MAGVNFVGGVKTPMLEDTGMMLAPGFTKHLPGLRSDDLATRIDAVRAFLRDKSHGDMDPGTFERTLGWSMIVRSEACAA